MGISRREEPVDQVLQFAFVNVIGDALHLADTDSAAQPDNSGMKESLRGPVAKVALLPVLKLIEKAAVAVDGGEHLQQRYIMFIRKKGL